MDVNECERLSNITIKTIIKVKELYFYFYSATFHSHSKVISNEVNSYTKINGPQAECTWYSALCWFPKTSNLLYIHCIYITEIISLLVYTKIVYKYKANLAMQCMCYNNHSINETKKICF